MISLYTDQALTRRVTLETPKRFLLSTDGATRSSTLWLGDGYTAGLTAAASSGASTLLLDQTHEFPTSGQAIINGLTISYTGTTEISLTGVSGLTTGASVGDAIYPNTVWLAGGNVSLRPFGLDLTQAIGVSLKQVTDQDYNFLNAPLITSLTQVGMGAANAFPFNLQVSVVPGAQQEFTSWSVMSSIFYQRAAGTLTPPLATEVGVAAEAYGYVLRRDESLPLHLRLLPRSRQVEDNLPGFIIGQYRWRDQDSANAVALIPTGWDTPAVEVGTNKFIPGIGYGDDLAPIDLEQTAESVFLRLNHGSYFTGPNGYYLPSGPVLELVPANPHSLVHTLDATPRELRPLTVTTYQRDSQGFYEKDAWYTEIGTTLNPDGSAREDLPPRYFSLNRRNNQLTLSQELPRRVLFLGTISGQPIDYFELPIYPVDQVLLVYVDQGTANPQINSSNFLFDRNSGLVQVVAPSGTGVSIPGTQVGQPVFAVCDPAVAVLYETGSDDTRLIDTVDVNPAFAGIAGGYYYLQHRRQEPAKIILTADKPQISIPATYQSIVGLVAYGPVYFEEDYCLLLATAYSEVPGETVANATLEVLVDDSFTGLINYQDPRFTNVQIKTGGDGVATMIYTPQSGFGQYLPLASASGTELTLAAPIPISQIWNAQEGWLVATYLVYNNDPLFGMVGADPTLGEIPWQTYGTPGTLSYRTNGERDPWRQGTIVIRPIDAQDVGGHSYTSLSFTGTVSKLIYAAAIPTGLTIGAYFVAYLQRVTLRVQALNSDVISNTVLLQMDIPPLIVENPWLIIEDDLQGFLNQYRLGWVRPNQQGPNH